METPADSGAATGSVRDRLLADRRNLLDLGTRNRLINLPLKARGVRTIEVVDERSAEVWRLLSEGRGFTFLPGRELSAEERAALPAEEAEQTQAGAIPQPDPDEAVDERGIPKRQADTRLQTRLTSEGLQKRLFDIWYDARTLEEEQGVNILYLALGLLRWFEDDTSDVARHAPLALLPVRLDRTSAADRFTLRWRGEPPQSNLSLEAKLNAEFGLKLPPFGEEDELDLAAAFAAIAEAVKAKPRWQVQPDAMVLGFFSFAKFLMYRDLDPETWPASAAIDRHPLVAGLLGDGFAPAEPIVPDQAPIDPVIPPAAMRHIVDADASQAIVIAEVVRGRHLVVKGPPGTGKSQTITNVIAGAAAAGQRVLFVAEKMAALEVVHRRLREAGLGPLTLELHSSKASKRAVLEELKRTKDLAGRPALADATVIDRLTKARDALNAHADLMHAPQAPSGVTPYRLIGDLVRLRDTPGAKTGVLLDGAETWAPEERARRREAVADLADRLAGIGIPALHSWVGVRREALDPAELEQLARERAQARRELQFVVEAGEDAAAHLGVTPPPTFDLLAPLAAQARARAHFPDRHARVLADPLWRTADGPAGIVAAGRAWVDARADVAPLVTEAAWTADLAAPRAVIAERGASLFRFMSGAYRGALAQVQAVLKAPLPSGLAARLALIDRIIAAQAARRAFEAVEPAARAGLGDLWRGEASDWAALATLAGWRRTFDHVLSPGLLERFAAIQDPEALRDLSRSLDGSLPGLTRRLAALFAFLDLDPQRALGAERAEEATLAAVGARLDAWAQDPESVTRWIAFHEACRGARALGLAALVDGLFDETLDRDSLMPTFERATAEALRGVVFARNPGLKSFDGERHGRTVETFRSLDVARMALARDEIAAAHAGALPRGNAGIGPLGILNGEIAKKRNHLALRVLLDRAGPAIQQIKPIFMMSPLSVAQYLKPGALSFDLLVVDEASQIEPVDALGAVARCRQVVVVGDERQLPPTRFFAKLTAEVDEGEDEEAPTFQARDAESILDLCLARGMPARMLNWHYRSRHPSLIAVSNREFYEDRLFIVPSPHAAVASEFGGGMGLKFHHLPHATYDRGGTRTNTVEARAVADAVIAHARTTPELSLGVGTFSVAQRQAILAELETLRRAHPDTEAFFNRAGTEPFFVKNLENIQGDERDVIFISVGYGRTAQGTLPMAFGPLGADGGERRLNVLISRAKLRCEVFSSITGEEIDLERARSRGVAALKLFLTFAETGTLERAVEADRAPDSVFEEQVAERLRAAGHDVRSQIGMAGFFVDLAIVDPERPGRYLLGIECDGAQYHAARSARDRDRLRQRVLEGHGWIIHRIWSTDWFLRPKEEMAKVEAAIAAAKAEWARRDAAIVVPPPALEPEPMPEPVAAPVPEIPAPVAETDLAVPYREAAPAVPRETEPHLVPVATLATIVAQIVAVEGPVHEAEIATRIRSAWGLARTGSRIRDAVQAAIAVARDASSIAGGPFYIVPAAAIAVRDRSDVESAGLRKPEMLPPAEIEAALLAIVDANYGAARDELVVATARLFGFAATSGPLRETIAAALDGAVAAGLLKAEGGRIVRG